MEMIKDLVVPGVLVICLCVGYGIKKIPWLASVSNDYIPLIMLVLGATLVCATQGVSIETIGAGMLTGLASTGLHQAFTRLIDRLSDTAGE